MESVAETGWTSLVITPVASYVKVDVLPELSVIESVLPTAS